jgi:hypothetical protein
MAEIKFHLASVNSKPVTKFNLDKKFSNHKFGREIFKKSPQESLMALKQKLEERITKIQEGDSPTEIKQELIKNLKSQIKLLDLRMEEQHRQKIKQEEEKIKKKARERQIEKADSKEEVSEIEMEDMIQNMGAYQSAAKKMALGHGMKHSAKIYRAEAKVGRYFDESKIEKAEEVEMKQTKVEAESLKELKNINDRKKEIEKDRKKKEERINKN